MPKRVGLLGGTFDPVHCGHVAIAESFLSSALIDELWILLTPLPPHKQEGEHVDYQLRLKMLKAAFKNINGVVISTVERELSKPSYTVNTVRHLKKEYPGYGFYFCLGEDSLQKFHTWKFYEEIIDEAELLAAKRPGATHNHVEKKILDRTKFIEHEPYAISSSEVRQRVSSAKNLKGFVPDVVAKIIDNEDLYL